MSEARLRGRWKRFGAVAVATLVLVGAGLPAFPAAAKLCPAFPDCQWHCTSLYCGSISKPICLPAASVTLRST